MRAPGIEQLEVERRLLRLREPLRTAHGAVHEREILIVRAHAEDLVGFGEAAPLPGYDAEPIEETEAALRGPARSAVLGRAAGPEALGPLAELSAHARAAVETAMLDLAARASAVPLWQVLVPTARPEPLALNAIVGASEPEAAARAASEAAERGFLTVKVKTDGERDIERVRAVREAIGPSVRIRLDANRAWGRDRAIEMLHALHPLGVELVEEPLGEPTPAELAGLRAHSPVPLAADESADTVERAQALVEADAVDAVVIKLGRLGGPRAALAVALQAPAAILTSNLDGPIGIACAAHVAIAAGAPARGLAHGLATGELFEAEPPAEPQLPVPREPGLGARWH